MTPPPEVVSPSEAVAQDEGREAQSASSSSRSQEQSLAERLRDRAWLRGGLALLGAVGVQELGTSLAPHLKTGDFYPLSVAVGLSLYLLHLVRLSPPRDDRSRLRALWLPEQKRVALALTVGLVSLSALYLGLRLNRVAPPLIHEEIFELKPIERGLHVVSGTPRVDEKHYRWAFPRGGEADAPYLTPLSEFKGQLLVVSETPLSDPLSGRRGWLSEVSPLMRSHYASYRRHMGLNDDDPIYLLDLRGVWWIDPYGFAALLISLLSCLITLGSATRDPHNQSRLLFIPPELRSNLTESAEAEETEGTEKAEETEETEDNLTPTPSPLPTDKPLG